MSLDFAQFEKHTLINTNFSNNIPFTYIAIDRFTRLNQNWKTKIMINVPIRVRSPSISVGICPNGYKTTQRSEEPFIFTTNAGN